MLKPYLLRSGVAPSLFVPFWHRTPFVWDRKRDGITGTTSHPFSLRLNPRHGGLGPNTANHKERVTNLSCSHVGALGGEWVGESGGVEDHARGVEGETWRVANEQRAAETRTKQAGEELTNALHIMFISFFLPKLFLPP